MLKECFKCHQTKPINEFYTHRSSASGYLNKCKECTKQDVARNRVQNVERYREYDKERSQFPDRMQAHKEYVRAWNDENKKSRNAHGIVARAIRSGTLVRYACQKCNSKKSMAHHEDYENPLDVMWLCAVCHKQRHKELKAHQ